MTEPLSAPCTAFEGTRHLATGPLIEVALAIKNAVERGSTEAILAFDDLTGEVIDFDLRGTKADLIARLSKPASPRAGKPPGKDQDAAPRSPGRPKLGVISREVTLLPRHWEWLAAQPGGASATLRKLVEDAKRNGGTLAERRAAHATAYRFIAAIAGDRPGFEEATRALFADDCGRFEQHAATWPDDIRTYAIKLAFGTRPISSAQAKTQAYFSF
ncbi:MAG: DUF2239 family protein [Aliidongia sp.]